MLKKPEKDKIVFKKLEFKKLEFKKLEIKPNNHVTNNTNNNTPLKPYTSTKQPENGKHVNSKQVKVKKEEEIDYNAPLKVRTSIKQNYLFHYAHFVCDFLFPFICKGYYKYLEVIREKSLNQTIGVFGEMFKDIIQKNYEELPKEEYKSYPAKEIILPTKEEMNKEDFIYFQKFMWNKYIFGKTIEDSDYKEETWPEVVLIQRTTQKLVNIEEFETKGFGHRLNNGSERREIKEIEKVEQLLKKKFSNKVKMVSLEGTSIEYQVNLFYNAKIIVAAHGAALINLFYCKPGTIVLEAKGLPWDFFSVISKNLSLRHILCVNEYKYLEDAIHGLRL